MNQDSEALHAKPDIAQLLIVSGTRPEIIKLAPSITPYSRRTGLAPSGFIPASMATWPRKC